MLKRIGAAAAIGLAALAMSDPASAQAIRFDPSLQTAAAPLLTTVQFQGGKRYLQPGGRGIGGGGPRFGGGGPRFHGGERRFGGGDFRRGRGGFGLGAGVAGLAAGALIGGAIASQAAPGYDYDYDGGYGYAPPPPPAPAYEVEADAGEVGGDSDAYCAQRYRSYDPSSGTYLGYDGLRHPCP